MSRSHVIWKERRTISLAVDHCRMILRDRSGKCKVVKAHSRSLSVKDACAWWYSGAYLLETLPSVIYILMRHGHDPEEAIIRAVNDTKDNDTIAAIVGAAVGALHGKKGIPARWLKDLSGRTTDRDDGRVFELIKMARKTFMPAR
jgi:ADP-ribosyl-[dinitrogen reductase] hydrolase